MQVEIENRLRELELQQRAADRGVEANGVVPLKKLGTYQLERLWEYRCEAAQARAEGQRAGIHVLTEHQVKDAGTRGGELCAAWSSEVNGWKRVKVVLDSGAAESVAPRSMAPHFEVRDSPASKAGVYYTSANGGRLDNLGQQEVPVEFGNGVRAMSTFQIADVSRPLMSVGKVCSLGNRVLFGSNGGVIMNMASGQITPFEFEDGVYVFTLWIPPLSASPFGRPQ